MAVSIIFCHKFRKFESKFIRSSVSKAKIWTLKAPGKAVTASEVLHFCMRPLFDYIFNFYQWIYKKFQNIDEQNPPGLYAKDVNERYLPWQSLTPLPDFVEKSPLTVGLTMENKVNVFVKFFILGYCSNPYDNLKNVDFSL